MSHWTPGFMMYPSQGDGGEHCGRWPDRIPFVRTTGQNQQERPLTDFRGVFDIPRLGGVRTAGWQPDVQASLQEDMKAGRRSANPLG
jgi:hypothetical protein